jgi:uncharacterized protein (DUF342 family)
VNLTTIKADVDYGTGNMDVEGSLSVGGCVRAGFSVKVGCDLTVSQSIEASTVEVGGSLHVGKGVLGDNEASLKVSGDISLDYSQNAIIKCGGDLEIRESDANSQIECAGTIRAATGRGSLRSGTYCAGRGIEVIELGSELGAATFITVGRENELRAEFGALMAELKEVGQQIVQAQQATERFTGAACETMGTEEAKAVRDSMQTQRELTGRKRGLEACLQEITVELTAKHPALEVSGKVYYGVEISMAGKTIKATGNDKHVRFRFDRNSSEIVCESL